MRCCLAASSNHLQRVAFLTGESWSEPNHLADVQQPNRPVPMIIIRLEEMIRRMPVTSTMLDVINNMSLR